ncbi:cupin domain-containing protein [Luteimonas sp. RD2P54]|uniref:Cupin domain-containing protein n=1 Tax=Luteimonas endophytica TaxID=3042023 RepID=A0ABT6JCV7_9GAMM|nr:cupin domain-containing protein [Luteimonas endophytica]MDH5824452.1 cupin domain-containing protein [Luteimonas endophytica]
MITHPRPGTAPNPVALSAVAAGLARTWASTALATVGGARLKVLRMDARAYPPESHPHDEALLVLDGRMLLEVEGRPVAVEAGELVMVPAGTVHGVATGSHGTLLVIDPRPSSPEGISYAARLL